MVRADSHKKEWVMQKKDNKPSLKIVFLDLNGTVVDDWDVSYAAVRAIFAHHGKEVPPLAQYAEAMASNGDYHNFYLSHGINTTRDELYEIWTPAYRAHRREAVVVPGVRAFVRMLVKSGVEVHLLTAARRDFAEPLVQEAEIEQWCAALHYHIHDKAEQVRAVVHGMAIEPSECLIIGDLPSDMKAARSAGVRGAFIVNKHVPDSVREMAISVGCIAVARDFHGMRDALSFFYGNIH